MVLSICRSTFWDNYKYNERQSVYSIVFKMAKRRYTALQALDMFMNLESSDDYKGSDTSIPVSILYYL